MYKTTINYKNGESRVIESECRIVAYGMMEDSNLIELGTENGIDYLVNVDEIIDIRFNEKTEDVEEFTVRYADGGKVVHQTIVNNAGLTPKEVARVTKETLKSIGLGL